MPVCPDGRADRYEMLRWSISGRSLVVAGTNSAIHYEMSNCIQGKTFFIKVSFNKPRWRNW